MKTAIYIPDSLFFLAEKVAGILKMSRSELYAKAIEEYLETMHSEEITRQLNSIYEHEESSIDQGIYNAQLKVLEKEEW